jgi:hypothetical protein
MRPGFDTSELGHFELKKYAYSELPLGTHSWKVHHPTSILDSGPNPAIEQKILEIQKINMSLPEKLFRISTTKHVIGSTLVLLTEPLDIFTAYAILADDMTGHLNKRMILIRKLLEYFNLTTTPSDIIVVIPGYETSNLPIYRYFHWSNRYFTLFPPTVAGGLALSFYSN